MTFNVGDRVRSTPAAVKRDRNLPSHDCAKRSILREGTVVGKRVTPRGIYEYRVRWDTAPGCPFNYYYQMQSPNMLQLVQEGE